MLRYQPSKRVKVAAYLCLLFALQGCVNTPKNESRYSQAVDSAPSFSYEEIAYIEPTPVYEPYNIWNSRPYEINGRYYTPLLTGKGYSQEGYASWYGQKFHGHTTANGETFDMFSLTAAHTTLPLPSFVRVTNLENDKSIIVRVNDRGPFHNDRIIDLSYAAAKHLGFKDQGVTRVRVDVIHVDEQGYVSIGNQKDDLPSQINEDNEALELVSVDSSPPEAPANLVSQDPHRNALFVQVLALSDSQRANELAKGISDLLQLPIQIPKLNDIYRLHVGPIENEQTAEKVIEALASIGFENAFTVAN